MADYSGAEDLALQRRSIRVALGEGERIEMLAGPFTRTSLVRELVARLADYSRRGIRALVGIDHQYGIPKGLAEEIGLGGLSWRDALTQLYKGGYGAGCCGPRWEHPRRFAAAFNDFLREQGRPDFFWSATKWELYGLRAWFKLTDKSLASLRDEGAPEAVVAKLQALKEKEFATWEQFLAEILHVLGQEDLQRWQASILNIAVRHGSNPRAAMGNPGVFRLTELCRGVGSPAVPKPLSRVGDNGSVGGQSCCGMGHLLEVLQACEQEKVPVAVWPMDGLDIQSAAYAGKHVFAEPYPSAKRDRAVKQTDENDARESVRFLKERDQRGELPAVCDLSTLTPDEAHTVQLEGWILSHLPWNRVV